MIEITADRSVDSNSVCECSSLSDYLDAKLLTDHCAKMSFRGTTKPRICRLGVRRFIAKRGNEAQFKHKQKPMGERERESGRENEIQ